MNWRTFREKFQAVLRAQIGLTHQEGVRYAEPFPGGCPVSAKLDVRALQANFDIWMHERGAGLTKSKAFERYVFEQVLKDYDPADEDLDLGDFGSGDDGGVDGMYLYIGGQLMGPETATPLTAIIAM